MEALVSAVRDFARDEAGITAIEYGLIAAVMVVAISTSFEYLKDGLTDAFTTLKNKLAIT